ncbi:hypothetical protein HDU77_004462 [Chytriomyces hyalinus]|nr:hypothetical protein HDU77_004462 [Chytriomyces hyalinus]
MYQGEPVEDLSGGAADTSKETRELLPELPSAPLVKSAISANKNHETHHAHGESDNRNSSLHKDTSQLTRQSSLTSAEPMISNSRKPHSSKPATKANSRITSKATSPNASKPASRISSRTVSRQNSVSHNLNPLQPLAPIQKTKSTATGIEISSIPVKEEDDAGVEDSSKSCADGSKAAKNNDNENVDAQEELPQQQQQQQHQPLKPTPPSKPPPLQQADHRHTISRKHTTKDILPVEAQEGADAPNTEIESSEPQTIKPFQDAQEAPLNVSQTLPTSVPVPLAEMLSSFSTSAPCIATMLPSSSTTALKFTSRSGSRISLHSGSNSTRTSQVLRHEKSALRKSVTLSREGIEIKKSTPRASTTSISAHRRASLPNSSAKSVKSRKAELDRCMSPSSVLSQIPKNGSSITVREDISKNQMSKFLNGFKRFRKTYFGDNTELFNTLRNGQSPKTLLIACCDSRVDPAIITDCEPGDMFVVRNVANIVAPYHPDGSHHGVSAAIEFAVKGLKVQNIVVMGHTKCGGIAALMRGITDSNETEFLGPWMKIAEKARSKVLKHFSHKEMDVQCRACEHASILLSLENLVTYPWVRDKLMNESISIHGWYFDFEDGELLALNPETLVFESMLDADENFPVGAGLPPSAAGHVQHEHESFS